MRCVAVCSFPEVKRPEREVEHSPPSSAEVMNKWSCTSAVPIRLRGLDRDNFMKLNVALHGVLIWEFTIFSFGF